MMIISLRLGTIRILFIDEPLVNLIIGSLRSVNCGTLGYNPISLMAFTFKFFTEVLFLSIILCLANTGIVNVLVSTLYSKPDEVTGYECGLYSTKGGRLKDRISFYTVGLTMMIFDVEVVLTFAFLLSLTFATTSSFLSVGIFVVILGLDLF